MLFTVPSIHYSLMLLMNTLQFISLSHTGSCLLQLFHFLSFALVAISFLIHSNIASVFNISIHLLDHAPLVAPLVAVAMAIELMSSSKLQDTSITLLQ